MRRSSDQEYVDCLRRFRHWRRWIAGLFSCLGGALLLLSCWLFVHAVLPGFSLADRDDQIEQQYAPPDTISTWSHHVTFFMGTLAGGVLALGVLLGVGCLAYSWYLFVGSRTEQLLLSNWDRTAETDSAT